MNKEYKQFCAAVDCSMSEQEKQARERQFEMFLDNEVKETGRTRQECTETFIRWYQTSLEKQTPITAYDVYVMCKSGLWCKALALETAEMETTKQKTMTIEEMQETIEPLVDEAHKREETALREYAKSTEAAYSPSWDIENENARNEAVDWQRIATLLCNLSAELSRKAGI